MLDALNQIDIAGWKDNPNVSVEIAKVIEKASWKQSPFESIMGQGSDRGVRTYKVANNQPYRPRLKAPLMGDGVKGNADLDTNLDNLEILSQTIYPCVRANSLVSPIKQYSDIMHINFIKEGIDSLTSWIREIRDRHLITALSNDFTNAVVCDGTNGFKDTTAETSVQNATKKIVKGDVCNVKALRRAIFMARSGLGFTGKATFPMKPIASETISEGGISIVHYSYLILLDTYAVNQLKNDVEWIEMQKYAGVRGDKNRLFSGLIGEIDGCLVVDMGVWTKMQAGFLNSEVPDSEFETNIDKQNFTTLTPPSSYADKQPVCIGALIGASALIYAGAEKAGFYIDDTIDAGRKAKVGADLLMAVSKARFMAESDVLSPYSNTDYATIGIFCSKE